MFRIISRATLICGLLALLPFQNTQAQDVVPSMGKTFWLGFMQNYQGNSNQALQIFVSSYNNTSGTVTMPLLGWSQNFTVTANVTTTITVPLTAMHQGSEVIDNKSFLIETEDTVAVFAINFEQYTADGTTVYPTQSLGTEYRIFSYRGLSGWGTLNSEFLIVATEDGTEVEITPSVPTLGGQPAGVPFTVNLNAGETYQVQAAAATDDLTGTTIVGTEESGSCRPFAVFSGSVCTNIPANCTACDHVYNQNLPRTVWGQKYFSVPFSSQTAYTYRIMADVDGTVVTRNGANPVNLNAGQFVEVNTSNQAICFEGNQPFGVAQYMEGASCSVNGDPALVILNAAEQKINNVTFATVQSTVINAHFLNIVVDAADATQVTLDGAPVPAALFNSYTGCPNTVYASMPITQGSHTLSCPGGLTGYIYGTGGYESYAYSVGSFTPVPPLNLDSVYCGVDINGNITLAAPVPLFNPFWTTLSAPEDTLHYGLSYTFTPTASDVFVVTGYENLSNCEEQYLFSVELDDPPVLSITANDVFTIDPLCAYTPVQLNVIPDPPGTYLYSWTPTAPLNNSSIPNPIATPSSTTWFRVAVSTLNGCAVAVDSILVEVIPGNLLDYDVTTEKTALCLGDSSQLELTVQQIIARDDFNNGAGPIWEAVTNGTINDVCGSVTGNALYFDGAGNRLARTIPLNVVQGGTVRFALKVANGTAPCGDAAPGQNILLEYSVNNGVTWTLMNTYFEYQYPDFVTVNAPIPPGAMTMSTQFRWSQPVNGGPGLSNWVLDDVAIGVYDDTGLDIGWFPAGDMSDPGILNPMSYPTSTGWYGVSIFDPSTQCTYLDSVFITVGEEFSITMTPDTSICDIAGIQLQAVPSSGSGHVWAWTPNNGTLSSTTSGNPVATPQTTTTYNVTVTSAEGCIANGDVSITVNQLLGVNITTPDDDLCQGESTPLNTAINGNTTDLVYSWSPGGTLDDATAQSPVASPVQTTNYILTVTDTLSGCLLVDSILINVSTLYGLVVTPDTTVCTTAGFQLSVQHNVPNANISWTPANYLQNANTDAPTIIFPTSAEYIVVVSDPLGCSATDTVDITVAFDDLVFISDSSLCAGDLMVIDAGYPGSTYAWSNGATTQTIEVGTADDYTVVITDDQGCQTTFTTVVTVDPLPVIVLGPDTSLCIGQTWNLDAGNPGAEFLWNTGETTQTISLNTDDLYWVQVIDANTCVNSDSIDIVFDPLPVIQLNDQDVCVSETITLDAENPGSFYLWSTGETTQTIDVSEASGTYWVIVTTPTICIDSAQATLTFVPFPVVDIGPDTALCDTESITLDAGNPGDSYLWSTGSNQQTITLTSSHTAWVDVYNGFCTTRDSAVVVFNPLPNELSEHQRTLCLDSPPYKAQLDAENPDCSFLWNTGETTQTIIVNDYGWYNVQITTPLNCTITEQILLEEYCPSTIYLPNAFTPDGDGVNDFFFPLGNNIAMAELLIFNRWGELIHSGKDNSAFWDGTMGGDPVQDGVYIWKLKYRFSMDLYGTLGPELEQTGHVTLLR